MQAWCVSCRLRKLDPEEEDDPFNNYEVPSEAKLESFPSVGPHRLSFDSATFMESGRQCHRPQLSRTPSPAFPKPLRPCSGGGSAEMSGLIRVGISECGFHV